MNDVLARLYRMSGKKEFLETACYFDNEKLFLPLEQQVDALENLHANQHIPQIIGAMEIFRGTGEKDVLRYCFLFLGSRDKSPCVYHWRNGGKRDVPRTWPDWKSAYKAHGRELRFL